MGPALDRQLGEHIGHIILDCLVRERQLHRNFFVGIPFGNERDDTSFLRRQAMKLLRKEDVLLLLPEQPKRLLTLLRIEIGVPSRDGTNRFDQFFTTDIPQYDSLYSRFDGMAKEGGVIVLDQDDDSYTRKGAE